jgi:class 3 adenylate cyclase
MLCPICSNQIAVGNRLCPECGATLDRVERQVRETENSAEVQTGAALCAGVEGYIRLCEVLPLLEVGAIVNEYLERLLSEVQAGGGQINWYNGDKIIAYFGFSESFSYAPAAAQAVQTALRLHETFAEFSAELFHSYASDLELELRVGIASGELLRSTLGDTALARPAWSSRNTRPQPENSRHRYRRIVIGDAVNLAQQLEYEARPGHVMTDYATKVAAPEFEFKPVGMRIVRRRRAPVEVFSVIGPRSFLEEADALLSQPV